MSPESNPQILLDEEARLRARRWLRYLLILSLIIFTVVIWAEFPQPQEHAPGPAAVSAIGPDDQLIIPGERVGFLRLGLNIQTVEQRLGRGKAKPTQTAVLYRFDQSGLTCAVQRGQVISVLINNPELHTIQGVAVGSDADAVVRELGDQYEYEPIERALPGANEEAPPAKVVGYTLHYWRHGIHINLSNDRVDSIMVTGINGGS